MMCPSTLIITVVDKSLLGKSSLPHPPLSEIYLLLQKREKSKSISNNPLVIYHREYLSCMWSMEDSDFVRVEIAPSVQKNG